MTLADKDPFSQVFTALWQLARSSSCLMDLVKLGNQIRYDTNDSDPEKRSSSTADYTELVLVSDGLTGNLHATSSSGFVIRTYSWYITTGELRITDRMLPVEWELFRALNNWKAVLSALTWQDLHFVKRLNIATITNGVLRPAEREEGPIGWASIWTVEVEMHFPTELLLTS